MGDKKGLSEIIVRVVMSLYHGAKTKVRMGSELSKEFLVKVGVHQGVVLSPLLFAITVVVITKDAREQLINKIFYADDLVLIIESIQNLKGKFLKLKETLKQAEG